VSVASEVLTTTPLRQAARASREFPETRDAEPPAWLVRARLRVDRLYREAPELPAGAEAMSRAAIVALNAAVRRRDWDLAAAALVLLLDCRSALLHDAEALAGRLAEFDAATRVEYRAALRQILREQHDARREAYRAGVNEGQRAFCEGRKPRRGT
jgi:hypothetical protein